MKIQKTICSWKCILENNLTSKIFNVSISIYFSANSSKEWSDIDFNEQFMWVDANQMQSSFKEAIIKGLPFPILTVAEYFTTGQDGLAWGRQYRTAGYFAIIMLW